MIALLDTAVHKGLRVYFDDARDLKIAGPRAAEATAKALVEHRKLLAYWLTLGRVSLDWRDSSHWGGDKAARCHYCRKSAFLLDDDGRPAHKVCTEAEIWRRLVDLAKAERKAA